MLKDVKKIQTMLHLWDSLDNMVLYMPLKQLKDETHRILVHEDDENSGLYMLRVFTSRDDCNEYALNYPKEVIGFSKISLDQLELYMRKYSDATLKSALRLSRCVLSTVDIDRKVRDIEILWSIKHN